MKCPHCTTSIHESWSSNRLQKYNRTSVWHVRIMECPACHKDILHFGEGSKHEGAILAPSTWQQIYPFGSSRPPLSPDVPNDIAADYNEAALVLPLSPKASAALSRRCLQSVLWHAGYSKKDLSKQIDDVLAEADTRKALPTSVHSIVDAIRNFGNFSAHKITDQTTLQVLDVEPHEAEYCLEILDALFDHYFVKPTEAQRLKAELNVKLTKANKPQAK